MNALSPSTLGSNSGGSPVVPAAYAQPYRRQLILKPVEQILFRSSADANPQDFHRRRDNNRGGVCFGTNARGKRGNGSQLRSPRLSFAISVIFSRDDIIGPMRLKLIACEIMYRELCTAVARSVNLVDVEFLPKGLHDIGQAGMSSRLAEVLAGVDETRYEAVLLGYGLCSNGLVGLAARSIPLVVPRAHDCITLFLGSKERYLEYFQGHPGVYFKTSGWISAASACIQGGQETTQSQSALPQSYEDLVARYGEDNAQFLYEELCNMRHYAGLTYIEMGIEPDDRFQRQSEAEAEARGWQYEKLSGDMRLLQGLLDGPWDEDRYLVVPPGKRIAASFDRAA